MSDPGGIRMASRLAEIVQQREGALLSEWMSLQSKFLGSQRERISDSELRTNLHDFVLALKQGLASGKVSDLDGAAWASMREVLTGLSRQRASQGFTPAETAMFVFSFKPALFNELRQTYKNDPASVAEEILVATDLLDRLGLYTTDAYQKTREAVIIRQQQEMLELSTPVVELWTGILALPLIGTLDSARTQIVMQNLLEAVVAKSADLAIIDITGVPTVDTLVAQHLLKTVAAARLMGAECIISGIRPQIAQTIIHLGVDLGSVITKANLADAFRLALRKRNLAIAAI
jgi:rsbT co-antagonist protein RsbR